MRNKVTPIIAGVLAMFAMVFIGPQAEAATIPLTKTWLGHKRCLVSGTKYVDSQLQRNSYYSGSTQVVQLTGVGVSTSGYGYGNQISVYLFQNGVQKDAWSTTLGGWTNISFPLNTIAVPVGVPVGYVTAKVYVHTTTGNSCTSTHTIA